MNRGTTRLELHIDVFKEADQIALVLPDLKPPQLVGAILQEFRELEYLGDTPAAYHLLQSKTGEPLNDEVPLGEQLQGGARLRLEERETTLPVGTSPPSQPIYLREQPTGKAYRLAWQPAIIGRVSENQPLNELVAVDLRLYPTGLRASRRHVKISEEKGTYYVETISRNPASLLRDDQVAVELAFQQKHILQPGDIIRLDRSDISFKFIVRQDPPPNGVEEEAVSVTDADASVPEKRRRASAPRP
jgi:pSer/pThr/pTyr-binding forkhead associated (FHA) protein